MEILIRRDLLGFKSQLNGVCNKIDLFADTLGLDANKIIKIKKTNALVSFVFDLQASTQQYSQDLSKYTRQLFRGLNGEPLGAIPLAPVYPAVLPEVTESDAYSQLSDLIQDCKRSRNFTSSMAEELGVLAPGSEFKPEDGKPVFKADVNHGGHPHIHLKNKDDYQGFEIWKLSVKADVQTGGGQPVPPTQPEKDNPAFRKLERVFGVDYVDPEPLPPFGQAELWHYKMIFILKNGQVGSWSGIESVVVAGVV